MKLTTELKTVKHQAPQNILLKAMLLFLPVASQSTEYIVSASGDDGTGLSSNSLSWAILQSNTNPGPDLITLTTDVSVDGIMKRLIDSDVTIQSDQVKRTINGNNQFRPLFVKSGNVLIDNIEITMGLAEGGDGAAAGAGMGGALFLYDGNLTISDVTIDNSSAVGGERLNNSEDYSDGGGGMFGNAISGSGGGLFGIGDNQTYANYQNIDPRFGLGAAIPSVSGGFGGGGAGRGRYFSGGASDGGFGGGGGSCYCAYGGDDAGSGGFGAAGGNDYYSGPGLSGYGAVDGNGAGFGGAIFVRSGSLDLIRVSITNSSAAADSSARGLGGGIFVMHTITNSNNNNQGMPNQLPAVNACELLLVDNSASSDPNSTNNNDDIFDLASLINSDTGNPVDVSCEADIIFANDFEDS